MSAFDSAHSSAAAAERNTRRSGSDGRVVPRARANSRCFQTFKVRTPSGERLWDEAFAITGRVIFFPCALFPFNFMLLVFFLFFFLLFLTGRVSYSWPASAVSASARAPRVKLTC